MKLCFSSTPNGRATTIEHLVFFAQGNGIKSARDVEIRRGNKQKAMGDEWCLEYLHTKLSPCEIKRRVSLLRTNAEKGFPESGCFELEWVGDCVREIDRLWYKSRLLPALTKRYGGLLIKYHRPKKGGSDEGIAAYVEETHRGRRINLFVNQHMAGVLFAKGQRGYQSGGLLCKDKLQCFLYVLLHESLHLVLTLCERCGLRNDEDFHGPEFQAAVHNLFGQTDVRNGMLADMEHHHDLETTRREIARTPRQRVLLFTTDGWVPARTVGLTPDGRMARVVNPGGDGTVVEVHPGLLKLGYMPPEPSTPPCPGNTP